MTLREKQNAAPKKLESTMVTPLRGAKKQNKKNKSNIQTAYKDTKATKADSQYLLLLCIFFKKETYYWKKQ